MNQLFLQHHVDLLLTMAHLSASAGTRKDSSLLPLPAGLVLQHLQFPSSLKACTMHLNHKLSNYVVKAHGAMHFVSEAMTEVGCLPNPEAPYLRLEGEIEWASGLINKGVIRTGRVRATLDLLIEAAGELAAALADKPLEAPTVVATLDNKRNIPALLHRLISGAWAIQGEWTSLSDRLAKYSDAGKLFEQCPSPPPESEGRILLRQEICHRSKEWERLSSSYRQLSRLHLLVMCNKMQAILTIHDCYRMIDIEADLEEKAARAREFVARYDDDGAAMSRLALE
jgi:hypothetical protein